MKRTSPDVSRTESQTDFTVDQLIDMERLKALFDAYHATVGLSTAILSMDGTILFESGEQRFCSDFHREHPQSRKICIESSQQTHRNLAQTKAQVIYRCPHGLIDAAIPIVVGGRHIADLYIGQFLLAPPDEETVTAFRQRAKNWGFDETAYIAALWEVPVASEKKITSILEYLKGVTEMVAEVGLHRLRQQEGQRALGISDARYRQLFELANDAIFILERGRVVDCNPKALVLFNARRAELLGQQPEAFSPVKQPDGRNSDEEIFNRRTAVFQGAPQVFEWRFFRKDGSEFDAEISVTRLTKADPPRALAIVRDISERKAFIRALQDREAELEKKSRYLEKVNLALKASLDHREVERRAVEENIIVNLKQFVFPYLEELEKGDLDTGASAYVSIIKTNLDDMVSRFSDTISAKYMNFTPTEVRIADLIRDGKNSKAVAQLLGLSPSSIQWHRKNIREKLGLTNRKVNLYTYLKSLSK